MIDYVIGSGPAGVSVAAALLERGRAVTMLDAGGSLEPAIQSAVNRLSRRQPEAWSVAERDGVKGELRYNSEGAPLKLAFGSDYVYRDVDAWQPVAATGVDAYRALATGGLSVLWGASILPYSDADFAQWPVGASEMGPYYVRALEMTGLAAEHDSLAAIYPLYVQPTGRLDLSSQARFVAERAARNATRLLAQGIHVGRARLAISQPSATAQSCAHCGMCLYGCPYGLIYSAAQTLHGRLATFDAFTYVPGVIVRRLKERDGGVLIEATTRDTSQTRRFEASRVYLAAGVLGSTAILLESLGPTTGTVRLRQSDHFLLPLLLRSHIGRVVDERLHTLSQLFIEILDPGVARGGVHLQLYTYSDLYLRMAKQRLGLVYPLMAPWLERLVGRVVMVKGYLHSDDSASITATLEPGAGGSRLRLDAEHSTQSDRSIRHVMSSLSRNRYALGASPMRVALRKGRPGSGVHVGGSFPMRVHPTEGESDVWGRPVGFERVHVVDSSVFPTVPAPSPTLTIMANAFRIGSRVGQAVEGA